MTAPRYLIPPFEPFCTKIIFYRIPKNASTSIYDSLGFHNVIKNKEKEIESSADPRLYKSWFSATHMKPSELKNIMGVSIERYFSFCVVRNPWDRAVSMYKFANKNKLNKLYGIEEDVSFSGFCKMLHENKDNPFFIASHQQVQWSNGDVKPSRVIKFENLQEEYSQMITDIGLNIQSVKLPVLNSTTHKHYSYYYDRKSKELINEVFYDDVMAFNYSFDHVFDFVEKTEKNETGLII